jgi:hypothetical protein
VNVPIRQVQTKPNSALSTNGKKAAEAKKGIAKPEEASDKKPDSQALPEDKVDTSSKLGRKLKKGFMSAASTSMAAVSALTSIPEGIQIGLDTKAGKSDETKRLNAARVSTLTSVATSSAVGALVLGPVGFVVGGVVGYLKGTIENHLQARSGVADAKIEGLTKAVEESVGESKGVWGSLKAMAKGAVEGAKHGYKDRKVTSKIQLSGTIDGIKDAVEDTKAAKPDRFTELEEGSRHNKLTQLAMRGAGILFGTAGVMINAPGGMVIGILESLKETSSYVPSQMTKNTMLWATNVGKFLPAAAIAGLVGGPIGIAASTAVGVATASITSMIDGRLGVNNRIAQPVKSAVKEAHGEQEVKENLRAYYRAGKGATVGLAAGVREGWKSGYRGGVEVVRDIIAATPESIERDSQVETKS